MTNTTLNFQNASGHEVLAAVGKKYLRPGGRIATEQLCRWANFQPSETVLELASSFGYSAISLAQRYGVKVVGVEKNPDSVVRARENVRVAGLENQIEIIEGDIFHLDVIPGKFDYVLAEAILTMQSPLGKAKLLAEIHNRLKPGGKFLSHELLANDKEEQIRADLARVIRVNSTPLSETNWIAACETAGLKVEKHQIGSMNLLNLWRMFQDEGIFNTIQILVNILTHKSIRERVLAMRHIFNKYRHELGYIILCAVAQEDN
ncbi:methyltransferase [Trichormus variabilis ATCC 29413]|uniref:Methyltransferase n=2 Tax=Anabaena variabilis TaxID=264691 RepID=Q3M4D5_TRIV2|nr:MULTISPECIES: class I SAM-dependent methyltransferase [Nostocaceae]ABA24151.1 methyltransferase [Trichormus variabilis ATCC 29413]MBC1215406.1 methyltransferase domain-containing protein [Trichormus variabilis ARAD]MBC1255004.1 methyltransferase domain-containing protein [Trichormus variabilis V5]MBC1266250.1 methyltransferase domain-containing protein [Trichormus variabilis FSR]MBC1301989.1 methyltransferase domain-containing protein [Trichormus variabilis N2B]